MAVTNAFQKEVADGNIRQVRIMMTNSLLNDPTFAEFAELEHAAGTVSGLYDEHDGRRFEEDKANWNDEYMNRLMVQVVGNFSRERIAHLQEVVRYLHPVPARPVQAQPGPASRPGEDRPVSSYRWQQQEDRNNGSFIRVGGGMAAGGLIGCVGAAAVGASGTVIVGATVAGAAIGAAVAVVYDKQKGQ